MANGQRIDQTLRWHTGTSVFIHLCLFLGLFIEAIGFIAWKAPGSLGPGLVLAGGTMNAFSLTVLARRRNRSWRWGLLGFLHLAGAIVVFRFLKRRCERCATILPPDSDRCRRCQEQPIPEP